MISATLTDRPTDAAIVLVPIDQMRQFLSVWSRAVSAQAIAFELSIEHPGMMVLTIEAPWAECTEQGYWRPRGVLSNPIFEAAL